MFCLRGKSLRPWMPCLALATSLVAVGCGSSTGTISGKVYYKDAPLKGGRVTFVSKDKKVSRFDDIKEDGSYKIEKMPAGEARIAVDTSNLKPSPGMNRPPPPKGANVPPGYNPPTSEDKAKRYVEIPAQYADADKSGLTYTVKGGSQPYDIKLK